MSCSPWPSVSRHGCRPRMKNCALLGEPLDAARVETVRSDASEFLRAMCAKELGEGSCVVLMRYQIMMLRLEDFVSTRDDCNHRNDMTMQDEGTPVMACECSRGEQDRSWDVMVPIFVAEVAMGGASAKHAGTPLTNWPSSVLVQSLSVRSPGKLVTQITFHGLWPTGIGMCAICSVQANESVRRRA